MQVRTYRARSLKEALQMVQRELGPDTTVVQTREVQTSWWDRFAHGRHFEIQTRRPRPKPVPLRRRGASRLDQAFDTMPSVTRLDDGIELSHRTQDAADSFTLDATPREAPVEKRSDADLAPEVRIDALLFDLLSELIDAEVPEVTTRELMEQLRGVERQAMPTLDELRVELCEHLAKQLPLGKPIAVTPGTVRVVALVGPTGVGKTTTIAKLAAQLRLKAERSVGLITVDTFRIGAVDQLRTYAEIMDLPMEVVTTPQEMGRAVSKLSDQDVILIDTAGRSPQDALQLQQLKALLHEAKPDEVHLVISSGGSSKHLQQTVEKFLPIGATAVIATKLDEATGLGTLLPGIQMAQLPFSYLTCGQNVPDDMLLADRDTLVPVLLGQRPISSLGGTLRQ